MIFKIYQIRKIIFLIFFQLFFFQISLSETIKQFNIVGNDRVAKETIIMFSSLEIGDEVNDIILNEALKIILYRLF